MKTFTKNEIIEEYKKLKKTDGTESRETFNKLYSRNALKKLNDKELAERLFTDSKGSTRGLFSWLEWKSRDFGGCKAESGGQLGILCQAGKFSMYRYTKGQKTPEQLEIDLKTACRLAKTVLEALEKSCDIIEQKKPESLQEYRKVHSSIKGILNSIERPDNKYWYWDEDGNPGAFFIKYFMFSFESLFATTYAKDKLEKTLKQLSLTPCSKEAFLKNAQLVLYQKKIGADSLHFGQLLNELGIYDEEKNDKKNNTSQETGMTQKTENTTKNEYILKYSQKLITAKNVILHGAPGTGKSFLAKNIAADIVSGGMLATYSDLSDEQKKQIEFVQFHPGYDYSDFVEGLRPIIKMDGSMTFELQDGIFKSFISAAKKNMEDASKTAEILQQEVSAQETMEAFFERIDLGTSEFETVTGNKFVIEDVDEKHIYINVPGNDKANKVILNINEIRKMLESGAVFKSVRDVVRFFGKKNPTQGFSYDFVLYKKIKENAVKQKKTQAQLVKKKDYVFIIDEINRGEISKIFGELFFAIDPGYRGEQGAVLTQYANMHDDPDEKFYIPENVYIIGTMNDIDRSVDSFDFAMRRRFRFIEIKASDNLEMLDALGEKKDEAVSRMNSINTEIKKIPDLNENYQIGAAYFLKLQDMDFDELWKDSLKPLLQDYIRGMYDEETIMSNFEKAYGYSNPNEEIKNEAIQD